MANCLVTKLKSTVSNANLPYFWYSKAFIDTTGASANITIPFIGDKTGTKVLEGGTFADGSTEIINNADLIVAPNTVMTILFPMYKCIPYADIRNKQNNINYSVIVYNFDDLEYNECVPENKTVIRISKLVGGQKYSGNLNYLIGKCLNIQTIACDITTESYDVYSDISTLNSLSSLSQLILPNTKITGNIENLINIPNITSINVIGTQVIGDRSTWLRNICQSNKTAMKARTTNISFAQISSFMTDNELNFFKTVTYKFSGSNIVAIHNGSTDVQLATYDIDTDTFELI